MIITLYTLINLSDVFTQIGVGLTSGKVMIFLKESANLDDVLKQRWIYRRRVAVKRE